jgi:prolipoprotein diacylglyceryltransferase
MFPDFQYLFESLFGAPMPAWLSILKTFGFFVAMAFIAAAWTLALELKRKEEQGLLVPQFKEIEIGKPASINELIWFGLLGFILGLKVGGFWGHAAEISPNPLGYLFSAKGNILVGIIGALTLAYIRYNEKKRKQLPEPEIKEVAIHPHERVADIVFIAAAAGLVGAKIFNALETWDDFLRNPAENLLSSSGLTFYGGLIFATASLYYYSRKNKINFRHLCDAAAPGLMLAYGIGRFGCHFSGDGDWGIYNSAYVTQPGTTILKAAQPGDFAHALYASGINYQTVPAAYVKAPTWLPDWIVAMNYPHNVGGEGIAINGCTGNYCKVLEVGVFPTSMYEAITCILLFCVLWFLRKRIKYALHLFGIYLILNGIERFLIEKIRVNYKYNWYFIHATQAEIISSLLIIAGICLLLFYKKKDEIVSERVKINDA